MFHEKIILHEGQRTEQTLYSQIHSLKTRIKFVMGYPAPHEAGRR